MTPDVRWPRNNSGCVRSFFILLTTLLAACSLFFPLSPEERANLESRTYSLSKTTVYEAVREVLKQYPMGIQSANFEEGTILSNVSGPQSGPMGTMVGYQVTVTIAELPIGKVRVTPVWKMNVSSDPFHPNLVDQSATIKPSLYRDFFDTLNTKLAVTP